MFVLKDMNVFLNIYKWSISSEERRPAVSFKARPTISVERSAAALMQDHGGERPVASRWVHLDAPWGALIRVSLQENVTYRYSPRRKAGIV